MILLAAVSLLPTRWMLGFSTSAAKTRAMASPMPLVPPTQTMVGDAVRRFARPAKAVCTAGADGMLEARLAVTTVDVIDLVKGEARGS